MLREKIINCEAGILTYGLTPPKYNNSQEKIAEIAQKQLERIKKLPLDGLILYDIQDEADRVAADRPFPFMKTVDPDVYASEYLQELDIPKIIYRCVGKYGKGELANWLKEDNGEDRFSVFVGASSREQKVSLTLPEAYHLCQEVGSKVMLGGVVIPERHSKYGDEHKRILRKRGQGCQFFVSQAVYNIEAAKNFLSEYYYFCQREERVMAPILMNLTPCGSIKTLEFMKWLGINIPKWLENDLMHSEDILDKSVELSKKIFAELYEFALAKNIPLGCSIESVSTRKVEIEASVELARSVSSLFASKQKK
ncbi:MAG: methylenetetrahydrofolate reductase [Sporomusaceae bacterium]|nr:methylenetetrahydrofolate reductase [Sporomusaceae bacterium]